MIIIIMKVKMNYLVVTWFNSYFM